MNFLKNMTVMNQPGQKILQALNAIEGPASLMTIANHVAEATNTDVENIKGPVRSALHAGVKYGFIQRTQRRCMPYMPNIRINKRCLNPLSMLTRDGELPCDVRCTGLLVDRTRRSRRPRKKRTTRRRSRSTKRRRR